MILRRQGNLNVTRKVTEQQRVTAEQIHQGIGEAINQLFLVVAFLPRLFENPMQDFVQQNHPFQGRIQTRFDLDKGFAQIKKAERRSLSSVFSIILEVIDLLDAKGQ